MTKLLLPTLTAAALLFSSAAAHAVAADEMTLARLSGVVELQQSGVAMVDFVQGHAVVAKSISPITPIAEIEQRAQAQTSQYYGDSLFVTFAMLALAALGFVGVTFVSRKLGAAGSQETPRSEGWREDLMRMLEADLNNLDSLTHGFPAK